LITTPERFEPGKRVSRSKRRQQVLACALVVFARDGIGRAGHTQIAELAGVSVTTVFKYFPTRKALVDAVLGRVERRLLKLVQEAHADASSAREAFHTHVRAWTRLAREEPEFVKIWLEWSASIRDEVWPRYLKLENRVNRILVQTLERDPAPRRMSDLNAARATQSTAHMSAHMIFSPDGAFDEAEKFMLDAMDVLIGFEESTASLQESANRQ
jgi:TetR/AcrR family transcriptional regulator, hemagglutinin/protease regulatory protein